jgi:hypothetical protein
MNTMTRTPFFNIEYRKVGGLRFIFVGRFTFMWCVSRKGYVETRNYVTIEG